MTKDIDTVPSLDRDKVDAEHVETLEKTHEVVHQLKSDHDDLGLVQTAWNFRKAVTICVLLCVAAAADGYQITLNGNIIANAGFINRVGVLNPDTGKYALAPSHTALWGALQSFGQMIGMIGLNPLSDKIGRKMTLYVLWLILAGSLIIESLVRDHKDWAGAKLLAGVGVGAIQCTLPIYITEWSPVNIRGGMICAYGVVNNFGNFIAPLVLMICKGRDPLDYKIPILTQWAFLAIMLPIFIYLPETPSFYAAKDQDAKGVAVLKRVNGKVPGYNAEAEYAIVKAIILEERAARIALGQEEGFRGLVKSYVECFQGTNRRRTFASALPACVQQLTGLSFLGIYTSLFLQQSGFDNAFEITAIIAAVKVGSILILTFSTDRFGRRPVTLIYGTLAVSMLMLIGILGQVPRTTATNNLLVFAACFWAFTNSAVGALGWAFVGEVSSQRLRARTAGLSAAIGVIFGLTFNTSVPVMLQKNGANWGYNTAWLFFGTGVVAVVLAVFFLPEVARRNPAELDELYEKRIPAWRMSKFVTDVEREKAAVAGNVVA